MSEEYYIQIPFDYVEPQVKFDCDDRDHCNMFVWLEFWDSKRSWLAERGYTLYDWGYHWRNKYCSEVRYCVPRTSYTGKIEYPFALFGGDDSNEYVPPLSADPSGRIGFAQDSLHRHCALKLVKESSEEYKIARFLREELNLENCEGVLLPVDFLQMEDHWIIVTPRWGGSSHLPWFSTVGEIIDYMRYFLKGLAFLHKNLIVHRDIKDANCLVSHFGAFPDIDENPLRKKLRSDGRLVYAIINTDLSIRLPPTTTPEDCRLPSNKSWVGGNQIHDTLQGELDYNPFAFDVGCLGVLFCENFQHLTRTVPMLAPLMDRMVTRDLTRRFTASQALEFLESFASKLTPKQLQLSPPERGARTLYEDFNRWKHLPKEFVRTWAEFREPKPSYAIKMLRRLCEHQWGRTFVDWVRRAIKFRTIIPPTSSLKDD